MSESQWEIIKPILAEARYRSLEEKHEQINDVFYFVKTGCQWRVIFPRISLIEKPCTVSDLCLYLIL
ncbi:MAG: transposase [Ruminococcus sp.]|nr:transposase [Ruminococcus sp.]